ncbi:hypothetical protein O6H91_13G068500 [Diphasiastrum complanatum]|uniref:Uncharacterized protein n=1 Tax=Diphasiastrum complanatum TaxID=34168 RepID=A0ACC2BVV3_DIPCM|nr:hypothetical protein O6H91_13G068500 [Diphasiastrum complanatum]
MLRIRMLSSLSSKVLESVADPHLVCADLGVKRWMGNEEGRRGLTTHSPESRNAGEIKQDAAGEAASLGSDDGKILAAVVLERLPVVLPQLHPTVAAFQEFSFNWRQQFRRHYPQQFFDMAANKGEEADVEFEAAPTITEADKSNDRRSLQRALDRRLYYIVLGSPLGSSKDMASWHFPEKEYENEENLRKCAESALGSLWGDISDFYFVGNAPCGHLAFPSLKRFFFRSQIIGKRDKFGHPKYRDYAWVSKDELSEYFEPGQMDFFKRLLIK